VLSNLAHAVPYRPMRWREQCGKKQRGKHKRKKEDRRKDTSAHIGEMPFPVKNVYYRILYPGCSQPRNKKQHQGPLQTLALLGFTRPELHVVMQELRHTWQCMHPGR